MTYRTRVASIYLLGFFIDLINMFIANVAYPDIARHFHAPVSLLAWVSNGYILGLTLVIPLSGWLAKRMGSNHLFILSLLIFILGTCGAGSATSMTQLIGWRLIQGLGGGLLIPLGQTLTYALYRNHERARLSATIMLIGLLAPALSPAFGGMIVDNASWRWVFFASLPLAVVTLILAGYWLKPDAESQPSGSLDFSGLLMSCAALTLLLLGLTRIGDTQTVLQGALLLLSGIILMAWYVYAALRKAEPLLNLRLMQEPLLRMAMLIYQFIPGLFTGVSLVAILYLQNQLGMHASQVGALMLPWALAAFVAISLTGKQFNRLGPQPLFIIGCVVYGVGILLLTQISGANDVVPPVAAFALMGFGCSMCSSTAQSCAFIGIKDDELADASALWNINRQLSFCFGVTLLSLLLNLLLGYAGMAPQEAYRLCFTAAASSVIIPLLLCLRIANRDVIHILNKEQP
jgi:EmrB/QacA subfamily drug resistance transporter